MIKKCGDNVQLDDSWQNILLENNEVYDYFVKIVNRVEKLYDSNIVYPNIDNVFRAFSLTKFDDVKVVLIGQDPYHGEGEANGLAFSLNENVKITPSLRNIFKELESDLGIKRINKDLSGWAKQGVLLLNTILTVEKDKPLSHKDLGWQHITDFFIKYIGDYKNDVVFILWGNESQKKESLIDKSKHLIIKSAHPSPLSASRGFFGSKPFSKTNEYLKKNNQSVIDWSL